MWSLEIILKMNRQNPKKDKKEENSHEGKDK